MLFNVLQECKAKGDPAGAKQRGERKAEAPVQPRKALELPRLPDCPRTARAWSGNHPSHLTQ